MKIVRPSGMFSKHQKSYANLMSCHSNYVQVFLNEAFTLDREIAHHRKQSSQVEPKERFRISVQESLRCERRLLGLVVVRGNQAALHRVPDGLEHQEVGVQVSAGVLGCLALRGHVTQQARQENGPLHVADRRAVSFQSQNQAVLVEFAVGGLHGFRWMAAPERPVEDGEAVCSAKPREQTAV